MEEGERGERKGEIEWAKINVVSAAEGGGREDCCLFRKKCVSLPMCHFSQSRFVWLWLLTCLVFIFDAHAQRTHTPSIQSSSQLKLACHVAMHISSPCLPASNSLKEKQVRSDMKCVRCFLFLFLFCEGTKKERWDLRKRVRELFESASKFCFFLFFLHSFITSHSTHFHIFTSSPPLCPSRGLPRLPLILLPPCYASISSSLSLFSP